MVLTVLLLRMNRKSHIGKCHTLRQHSLQFFSTLDAGYQIFGNEVNIAPITLPATGAVFG
jgi:hypothetical protein